MDTPTAATPEPSRPELLAATSEPPRPAGQIETPGAYTLAEAAEVWEVSHRTLRRRLAAGEVPGAYKLPGAKGESWRIPAAALGQLGYKRRNVEPPAPVAPPPPPLPTPAERIASQLGELLDAERKALASARDMYADAKAEQARLEERLKAAKADTDRERARADALAVELDAARKPRRRWGRRA